MAKMDWTNFKKGAATPADQKDFVKAVNDGQLFQKDCPLNEIDPKYFKALKRGEDGVSLESFYEKLPNEQKQAYLASEMYKGSEPAVRGTVVKRFGKGKTAVSYSPTEAELKEAARLEQEAQQHSAQSRDNQEKTAGVKARFHALSDVPVNSNSGSYRMIAPPVDRRTVDQLIQEGAVQRGLNDPLTSDSNRARYFGARYLANQIAERDKVPHRSGKPMTEKRNDEMQSSYPLSELIPLVDGKHGKIIFAPIGTSLIKFQEKDVTDPNGMKGNYQILFIGTPVNEKHPKTLASVTLTEALKKDMETGRNIYLHVQEGGVCKIDCSRIVTMVPSVHISTALQNTEFKFSDTNVSGISLVPHPDGQNYQSVKNLEAAQAKDLDLKGYKEAHDQTTKTLADNAQAGREADRLSDAQIREKIKESDRQYKLDKVRRAHERNHSQPGNNTPPRNNAPIPGNTGASISPLDSVQGIVENSAKPGIKGVKELLAAISSMLGFGQTSNAMLQYANNTSAPAKAETSAPAIDPAQLVADLKLTSYTMAKTDYDPKSPAANGLKGTTDQITV